MGEVTLLAQVLKDVTACDKINIAAIGNVVPQLHIHVVAGSAATRAGRGRSGGSRRRDPTSRPRATSYWRRSGGRWRSAKALPDSVNSESTLFFRE